jgi:hypothetical protein
VLALSPPYPKISIVPWIGIIALLAFAVPQVTEVSQVYDAVKSREPSVVYGSAIDVYAPVVAVMYEKIPEVLTTPTLAEYACTTEVYSSVKVVVPVIALIVNAVVSESTLDVAFALILIVGVAVFAIVPNIFTRITMPGEVKALDGCVY